VTEYKHLGKFDSVSIAGVAIFGALSVVLTTLSVSLGMNFPLLPYLQFDLGEIAIFLAFFIFGPIPAFVSAFVEFGTLMALGVNAPVGPVLKLVSILSSLVGVWAGTALVSHMGKPGLNKAAALGTGFGITTRVIGTTIANYELIVFFSRYFTGYSLAAILGYVSGFFKTAGITITTANGLTLILGFTAVFNVLQLLFVLVISYLIVRLPQMRSTKAAGRRLWIVSYIHGKD
jgi:riboflavin transporter FmnP